MQVLMVRFLAETYFKKYTGSVRDLNLHRNCHSAYIQQSRGLFFKASLDFKDKLYIDKTVYFTLKSQSMSNLKL